MIEFDPWPSEGDRGDPLEHPRAVALLAEAAEAGPVNVKTTIPQSADLRGIISRVSLERASFSVSVPEPNDGDPLAWAGRVLFLRASGANVSVSCDWNEVSEERAEEVEEALCLLKSELVPCCEIFSVEEL